MDGRGAAKVEPWWRGARLAGGPRPARGGHRATGRWRKGPTWAADGARSGLEEGGREKGMETDVVHTDCLSVEPM